MVKGIILNNKCLSMETVGRTNVIFVLYHQEK